MELRFLGIDPGLRFTGWGVVSTNGNNLSYLGSGTVCSPADKPLADRLYYIFSELRLVMQEYSPDECGVEEVFVNRNPNSTLKLGHARAAAILAAADSKVKVFEYAPNLIKKSVVGVGHADKNQINVMVKFLLPNAEFDTNDAADALAVAICHSNRRQPYNVSL